MIAIHQDVRFKQTLTGALVPEVRVLELTCSFIDAIERAPGYRLRWRPLEAHELRGLAGTDLAWAPVVPSRPRRALARLTAPLRADPRPYEASEETKEAAR